MASADMPTGRPVADREDAVAWAKRAARRDFELLRLLSKRPALLQVAVNAGMLGAYTCAYKEGVGNCAHDGATESGTALGDPPRKRREQWRRQQPQQRPAKQTGGAATAAAAPVAAAAAEQPPRPQKRRRRPKSAARKEKDAAKLEAKWRARRLDVVECDGESCTRKADSEAAAEAAMEAESNLEEPAGAETAPAEMLVEGDASGGEEEEPAATALSPASWTFFGRIPVGSWRTGMGG